MTKRSFDRLCLQAGTGAIDTMLAADAEQLCGQRYQRHAERQGHRWGTERRIVAFLKMAAMEGTTDMARTWSNWRF
jgi:hypothetical protein